MNTQPDPREIYTVQPAYIFDLDGTIRRSKAGANFPSGVDDIELFPDAEPKLWEIHDHGGYIVAASNQGGVAYGFRTEAQVDAELDRTVQLFKKNPFHQIHATLTHPKGSVFPYNTVSLLRKPHYGMLVSAETAAWNNRVIIDWPNSVMVGDRLEDRQTAENADVGITFQWAWDFFNRQITDQQYNTCVVEIKRWNGVGWPICPKCDHDDLRTHETLAMSMFPTYPALVQASIDQGMYCAHCDTHMKPRKYEHKSADERARIDAAPLTFDWNKEPVCPNCKRSFLYDNNSNTWVSNKPEKIAAGLTHGMNCSVCNYTVAPGRAVQ